MLSKAIALLLPGLARNCLKVARALRGLMGRRFRADAAAAWAFRAWADGVVGTCPCPDTCRRTCTAHGR
eukprot:10497445-Alexandrium_andersonii.AAC.1